MNIEKKLVVYYSHSGNTRKCAKIISEVANADIIETKPIFEYPKDLWNVVDIFKEDIATNARKEIEAIDLDISKYDAIFIGTPNWGNTVATPLLSFFDQYDLSNKVIIPFVTHGGGGIGNCAKDILEMAGSKTSKKPFVFSGGNVTKKEIEAWLAGM